MTLPADLLLVAGGEALERWGTFVRRTIPAYRGGEAWKETHTRADAATVATYLDRDGYVRRALANVLRPEYVSGAGGYCTLHEASRTNLITYSSALGSWTNAGSFTITADAVDLGALKLAKLLDPGGGNELTLTLTFTGNAQKVVVVHVKEGDATAPYIRLEDTTASANRLLTELSWSGGVPSATMTVGTELISPALVRDGVYRLVFLTTSVTAANGHKIVLVGAGPIEPGTYTYYGGVQSENNTYPSSLIVTSGSTVTRAADALTIPWYQTPEAMTVYAKFVERAEPTWVLVGGLDPRIMQIGAAGDTNPRLVIYKDVGTDDYICEMHTTAGGVGSTIDLGPVYGRVIELCGTLSATGVVTLHGAKDGVAGTSGAASSALTLASAWSDALLSLANIGATGYGDIALRSLKIARGVYSLDEMAAA